MNALEVASTYLNTEYVDNQCLFNNWFYGRNVKGMLYPWCVTFISYCLTQTNIPVKLASVTRLVELAHIIDKPVEGCLFAIERKHAGFVKEVFSDYFITVEGNVYVTDTISAVKSCKRFMKEHYLFLKIE